MSQASEVAHPQIRHQRSGPLVVVMVDTTKAIISVTERLAVTPRAKQPECDRGSYSHSAIWTSDTAAASLFTPGAGNVTLGQRSQSSVEERGIQNVYPLQQEVDMSNGNEQTQQILEPVEQESILFHNETIIAVRLGDGRICVVLRWICDSMKLQAGGQVRKIERTASTASELVRVRVKTKGGRQTMPALTLRGFSPWILSINPGEVSDDDPAEQERIRSLITAYQEEAKDVLYEHFVTRSLRRPALPDPDDTTIIEVEPSLQPMEAPGPDASHEQLATYHEAMALWHRWQADRHAQQWRGEVDMWRGTMEARIESSEAIAGLLPEILERLGPELISTQQQRNVQAYVKKLHDATGKPYGTIYDELKTAFDRPRYQEIRADEWQQVINWFQVQLDRAKR